MGNLTSSQTTIAVCEIPGPILYANKNSCECYRVQMTAKYCENFLQVNYFDESDKKLPITLIDGNVKITTSNAICFYLSNEKFKGDNIFAQCEILQWMMFVDNYIQPYVSSWILSTLGVKKLSKDCMKLAKDDSLNFMELLNKKLVTKTFFVGERITLADIAIFTALMPLFENCFDLRMRRNYENVNRWFCTLLEQDSIKEIVGNFTMCEKAMK